MINGGRIRTGPFYRAYGKRFVDVAVASLLLILAAPLMIIAASLIRMTLGAPVFFRQIRPGYRGVPFTMLKFRTMKDGHGVRNALSDIERITRLGRWLRKTSIDELPELFNVLRGDMSLVGPRPLLMEYLPRYSEWQMRRHEVRPGITGLAQVNGRNDISWEDKFRWDIAYVDALSFTEDVAILARTVITVISLRGVGNTSNSAVERFRGNA